MGDYTNEMTLISKHRTKNEKRKIQRDEKPKQRQMIN